VKERIRVDHDFSWAVIGKNAAHFETLDFFHIFANVSLMISSSRERARILAFSMPGNQNNRFVTQRPRHFDQFLFAGHELLVSILF